MYGKQFIITPDHVARQSMFKLQMKGLAKMNAQTKATQMPELEEAKEAAREEGRKAEKARITAILKLPEAKGRYEQAKLLAFTPDLSPEAAARVLAATPIAKEPKYETIEERAAGMNEFGASFETGIPGASKDSQEIDDIWKRAAKQANTISQSAPTLEQKHEVLKAVANGPDFYSQATQANIDAAYEKAAKTIKP